MLSYAPLTPQVRLTLPLTLSPDKEEERNVSVASSHPLKKRKQYSPSRERRKQRNHSPLPTYRLTTSFKKETKIMPLPVTRIFSSRTPAHSQDSTKPLMPARGCIFLEVFAYIVFVLLVTSTSISLYLLCDLEPPLVWITILVFLTTCFDFVPRTCQPHIGIQDPEDIIFYRV